MHIRPYFRLLFAERLFYICTNKNYIARRATQQGHILMHGTRTHSIPSNASRLRGRLLASIAVIGMLTASPAMAESADDRGYISPLPALQLGFKPLYPTRHSHQVAREEAELRAEAERQALLAKQRAKEEARQRELRLIESPPPPPFETGSSSYAGSTPPVTPQATTTGETQIITADSIQIPEPLAPAPANHIAPMPTGIVGHGEAVTQSGTTDIIEPGVHQESAPGLAAAHTLRLGKDTKKVLASVPKRMDTPHLHPHKPIKLERVSEDVLEVVSPDEHYKDYEKAGIRISMRRGVFDASRQLGKAYDALVAGDDLTAVSIYRDVVAQEPRNQEALFGLATTYHRAGSYDLAKPVYEQLLKVNPGHREGLNNFLSLVADYAPEDALDELEHIAARNPHFSPVHAQIGMLYSKLGHQDKARNKLLYAIRLAPHNLVYKYNLAVILDRRGDIGDAVALYRNIVKAHASGAEAPANINAIQNRLNFLVNRYNKFAG